MLDRVFVTSSLVLVDKLERMLDEQAADPHEDSTVPIDMESCFSQLTLDIIGLSVFNYDFNALNKESPIIQAVYTALKETETRATDLIPYWKYPILCQFDARQQKAKAAVDVIRQTTSELIDKCRRMVDDEEMAAASQVCRLLLIYIYIFDVSLMSDASLP